MKKDKRKIEGITLIALVITIIVLLILAGVTIASLSGDNGILARAKEAKKKTLESQKEEGKVLKDLEYYASNIENKSAFNEKTKVNEPQLATGMTRICFQENGETYKTIKEGENGFDINNWYNYEQKQWANMQTEDGSMWVWIPRFAYKINNSNQTVDVKFLIDTSDNYYISDTEIGTAKRQKTVDEVIDTTQGYTVHPAFTNESSIGFKNGGWDKELPGIWVAKFEAGYVNKELEKEQIKASSVNYSHDTVWAYRTESGKTNEQGDKIDAIVEARNYLDGVYGAKKTAIKFPVFKGSTKELPRYSMNYISHKDAFNISKVLIEANNAYGLSGRTDSHLMKNSEWGATAYLGKSQYGLNGQAVVTNNKNLNSNPTSAYAQPGYDYSVNGKGPWNQWNKVENIKTASTTETVYGVFDMVGGTWERTAAYINNGNGNLNNYGSSFTKNGSTKYVTAYPFDAEKDKSESDYDIKSKANYIVNNEKFGIYGDAVRETSIAGAGATSWDGDFSYFPALDSPFFLRGGSYWYGSTAGLLASHRNTGISYCDGGFRPVLVVL